MKALKLALPGIALAACALVPLLGKAFTVDDTVFLLEAQHLLVDPLHPTAFEIVWYEAPARLSTLMATGPAAAWLLVPVVGLGGAEWVGHLIELALLALAIVFTVRLGQRVGLSERHAALAGLILAATPAVLGMAGTCMPDVPAMAFGVVAMERLCAWRDHERWGQAIAAAALLALAMLTRSHLALLLPVGAIAVWPSGAGARLPGTIARRLAPLAAAPILAFLVTRITDDPQRAEGVAQAIQTWATLRYAGRNLIAFLVYWTLAFPLALPWALLATRRRLWWIGVLATIAAGFILNAIDEFDNRWWVAPIAGLAAFAFADILVDAWRRRDRTRILLGAWLALAAPVVVYVQMAPKYLIASAPALALLLADQFGRAPPKRARWVAAATLIAGTAMGILIVHADAEMAGLGRRAANELCAPRVQRGQTVWFAGHWGFQWYAQRAGAKPLTSTGAQPQAGDEVVASSVIHGHEMLLRVPDRVPEESFGSGPGGRVMGAGAGFYSDHWGFVPWWWGRGDADRYTAWRVK